MSARPEIVITDALSSTDDLAGAGAAPGAGAPEAASVPTHSADAHAPADSSPTNKPSLSITPVSASGYTPRGSPAPSAPHAQGSTLGHARRPSDPTLLSPILKQPGSARASLDLSSDDDHPPASPTGSVRSSVRFSPGPTSVDLRNNRVDAESGAASLALLGPPSSGGHGHGHEGGHRRKLSNATFTSERTVADPNVGTPPPTQTTMSMSTGKDIPLAPLASRTSDVATVREPGTPHMPKKMGSLDAKGVKEEDGEGKEERPALDMHEDEGLDLGLFQFGPVRLASLVDPKSMDSLRDMGGVDGLIAGLGTHATNGLEPTAATPPSGTDHDNAPPVPNVESGDKAPNKATPKEGNVAPGPAHGASWADRTRVYGTNVLPSRKSKSLWQLMWLALKDKVLVILSFAAVVSFALGLFQDFGTPREEGEPPVDWVEGVAIMVAILIVVLVGSVNDWQKERQFKALGEKRDERGIKVVRGGVEMVVDVRQVLVGDVALLEPGEVVPCDGVFLAGHNVRCDESGATGESDAIKKVGFSEAERLQKEGDEEHAHTDCFIISGSKVLEGYGRYVVIAVGPKSFNGRIMMAMRGGSEDTPLQLKLNGLAELIAKLGTAAGLLLFGALMIRFFVQLGTGEPVRTASQKGLAFVNILIIAVTIVVVAVPEGLPLAVTLALAFATKRMTKENLLVRVLGSCETMANASVVATDKTGTLTLNEMTIVAGSVGVHAKFVRRLEEHAARTNANDSSRRHADDFSLDQAQLNTVLGQQMRVLFNEAICVNSTAFEDEDKKTGKKEFVGSKTETALLSFAQELEWENWKRTRQSKEVLQMVPFSSERKAMGVVVRHGAGARIYLKGASEILTGKCTMHVVVREGGGEDEGEVRTTEITDLEAENISNTIIFYANQTLRTIALCYKDFESWPPKDAHFLDNERTEVDYDYMARDMTLIGIVGIEDPLRPGVREAVANCHRAGVAVKMCTGDNVLTARSIALQCGIYTAGGIVMEGPVFRTLDDAAMLEVVPRLQVLARSSPEDKQILVNKLKELGEIVGVTGDGTNDGPALKTANVGFSMGIAGTEVAKEASDIILMDDNFASIVKAIMWGRAVNDAVRKFLQFQIAVNITAVIITFVSAVASAEEESVLSAVQLLWVNIIMDTFAALALATDPATESSLDRKPERASAPLFDVNMYKQIFGQAAYQTAVALIFHFLGYQILGYGEHNKKNDLMVQTLVFNQFVFAQIFNSFNARRLDNKLNIFEGMFRNYYFMGITALEIAIQIMIVFVGGAAFHVTSITGKEWGISIALGFVSIPLGALIRCIPNGPCERLFIKLRILPNPASLLPVAKEPKEGGAAAGQNWNYAIDRVTDNLGTFANVRGGRMRGSSFVDRSRSAPGGGSEARPQMSALMAMVPTIVASTVGAGWTPAPSAGLSDPGNHDPSRSTARLWADKIEVHPDTKPDDFAYKRWGRPKTDV